MGREETGREETGRKRDIRHFRDLEVYRRAFDAAMRIYHITKDFPAEERFSLVDQIRRSSRSVCSNLAEAWRKRRYIAVFKNKVTDSMPALLNSLSHHVLHLCATK
ncbi:MAG: four helix bundle protein [Deltaproteobacteria bacterium]|nr:four helix bundle protein [Deltaproteobacteria bacterium]